MPQHTRRGLAHADEEYSPQRYQRRAAIAATRAGLGPRHDPRAPAWTESPSLHDYLHNKYNLKPRQNFDRCFDVAVVDSRVYFGSSTSGTVTCLDSTRGGKILWTFFTGGPVRFAPHVANDSVYFGSDDGFVYCFDAASGSVVWKERAGPSDDMIWGNEHMISVWPVQKRCPTKSSLNEV